MTDWNTCLAMERNPRKIRWTDRPRVQHRTAEIRAAIEEVRPGELTEVPI